MNYSVNAPLFERVKYSPESVCPNEITDALEDYHIICSELDGLQIDAVTCPETVSAEIDELTDAAELKAENKMPDYSEYKQFFEDCFARLNGHYPCPSVTSDYDCSVIFDAIEGGAK
jgi:hypothetical protein